MNIDDSQVLLDLPTCKPQWSWVNTLSGLVNDWLIKFSERYTRWRGIDAEIHGAHHIHELPFNLLIKTTITCPEYEVQATRIARAMGIPVPRILCHTSRASRGQNKLGSILMTKVPGRTLSQVYETYSKEELQVIMNELDSYLQKMRTFANPYGMAVCGPTGGAIRSPIVPPQKSRKENPKAYHRDLIDMSKHYDDDDDRAELEPYVRGAEKLLDKEYNVFFAHGDCAPWNVMVKDGHLMGIIDWEYAGWHPEFWDYVSSATIRQDMEWARNIMLMMPSSEQYHQERKMWENLLEVVSPWLF